MGYGYGNTTPHYGAQARDNATGLTVKTRFSNDMVVHVWNAQTQSFGQSSNGNLYFEHNRLYSYGTHYLVAAIGDDGVALLNAANYSIATSGHKSDARHASSNRVQHYLPDLTKYMKAVQPLHGELKRHAQERIRKAIRSQAVRIDTSPGSDGELTGVYLCRSTGLGVRAWPKLFREAVQAAEREKVAAAKESRRQAIEYARKMATMSDKDWRALQTSHAFYPAQVATNLRRARLAVLKTDKLGKRGLAVLRTRETRARWHVEQADILYRVKHRRSSTKYAIGMWRASVDTMRDGDKLTPANVKKIVKTLTDLSTTVIVARITGEAKTGHRLAALAKAFESVLAAIAEREERELAERHASQELVRLADEAQRLLWRQDWLAGRGVPAAFTARFDADSGGAALRVQDSTLYTSHGASVPLSHAVKVFRFVKLCRDKGESWQRNGATIRVGAFNVDSISAQGDFVAGCHRFTWLEIERVAKLANVFDVESSAEIVSHKESI